MTGLFDLEQWARSLEAEIDLQSNWVATTSHLTKSAQVMPPDRAVPAWLTAQSSVPQDDVTQDPLIDRKSDLAIYIGVALLVTVVAIALRAVSKRFEHLVMFGLALSLILILIALTL